MAKRLSKRNNSRSAVFIGIAVIAVVIAVAALSRNVAPLTRSAPGTNSDIVKMFDSELNISGSLSDIGVEYAFGNMSTELNSGAQQIHVLQSETIYSYRLGGYSKSVMSVLPTGTFKPGARYICAALVLLACDVNSQTAKAATAIDNAIDIAIRLMPSVPDLTFGDPGVESS